MSEEKNYIGVKIVKAKFMTRGDYNKFKGWTIPADENPADEGYLVRYPDGYISWCPHKQFEEAHSECVYAATENSIMQYFEYSHLPPKLQTVSAGICELAKQMDIQLSNGPEKSAGLRKLLEAKDCFVRAAL